MPKVATQTASVSLTAIMQEAEEIVSINADAIARYSRSCASRRQRDVLTWNLDADTMAVLTPAERTGVTALTSAMQRTRAKRVAVSATRYVTLNHKGTGAWLYEGDITNMGYDKNRKSLGRVASDDEMFRMGATEEK